MNKHVYFLTAATAALLTGCSMAPDYERPPAPIPADFPEGGAYQADDAVSSAPAAGHLPWAEFYTDSKLREVITLSLENNRDLRVATLNIERMRALYNIERSALLPTVNAGASADRARTPADLSYSNTSVTASQYSADFGFASWELDLFGRIRSMSDAALQEYFATEQASRSVQTMLVSQVATAYLTLAADQARLELAKTTLKTREDALDLVTRRYDRGLSPLLDVHRAQAQVDAAQVSLVTFVQLIAVDKNALNLLAGTTVPADLLPGDLDSIEPPAPISAGVSSLVLLNRPDIIEAEHKLMAANANIGAARAAFFPRISLTAAAGTASSDLSGLFKSGQGMWAYGAQITMPIFDPRTWAAVRVSEADKKIAIAQYEQVIQSSFREVADALAVRGTILQQLEAQREFVQSESEVNRLSNVRYVRGLDSYLSVLDSERELYAAQLELVSLELVRLSNQVKLYAVLGGGWQPLDEPGGGESDAVVN
ncbi:efflux transporter outer membrane subunit [Ruficoccus amylovorans]|uniref:Efflux transporter outer membrane subunit n=1 Tax=Ruficoccus amylovorans TaxID=1804625 RepID=A0A842HIQ3_9BACT|nr:efflux transporter outer membrane subunit [Ruficoccus amylovorans]MBC2596239.1 efflux transporter outer membrane subunit [Ruficoccus amylovorans]